MPPENTSPSSRTLERLAKDLPRFFLRRRCPGQRCKGKKLLPITSVCYKTGTFAKKMALGRRPNTLPATSPLKKKAHGVHIEKASSKSDNAASVRPRARGRPHNPARTAIIARALGAIFRSTAADRASSWNLPEMSPMRIAIVEKASIFKNFLRVGKLVPLRLPLPTNVTSSSLNDSISVVPVGKPWLVFPS